MLAAEAGGDGPFFEGVVYCVAIELLETGGYEWSEGTCGGRKNCSSTTYIPRIISVRRKYLPALSSEVSLLSSHRSFRGRRKPSGGGPAGVAAREAEEEKAAVARGKVVRAESVALGGAEVVSVRARPATYLVEAMAAD